MGSRYIRWILLRYCSYVRPWNNVVYVSETVTQVKKSIIKQKVNGFTTSAIVSVRYHME